MRYIRHVVVFDAANVATRRAFRAAMLGGRVFDDDQSFDCVIDADGHWRIGIQHAPNRTPPDWPHSSPQQVHIDLHADDGPAAHQRAIELGATVLRPGDLNSHDGHTVYVTQPGTPSASAGAAPPTRNSAATWRQAPTEPAAATHPAQGNVRRPRTGESSLCSCRVT